MSLKEQLDEVVETELRRVSEDSRHFYDQVNKSKEFGVARGVLQSLAKVLDTERVTIRTSDFEADIRIRPGPGAEDGTRTTKIHVTNKVEYRQWQIFRLPIFTVSETREIDNQEITVTNEFDNEFALFEYLTAAIAARMG